MKKATKQMNKKPDLRMNAYYYSFSRTGIYAVDKMLSAVACAGKAYHHTEDWCDDSEWPPHKGPCPEAWIQNAAYELAKKIAEMREALTPFAIEADGYDPEEGDDYEPAFGLTFTVGQLRVARRALNNEGD